MSVLHCDLSRICFMMSLMHGVLNGCDSEMLCCTINSAS
jgi:hypothetical protein